MDLERGSLAHFNVADIAAKLHLAARTGILRLSQAGIKKSIYFKAGRIVFVHSSVKHERLGEVLLRLGKITEEEFNQVSAELEEGRRLGHLLLQKGILSASEVTQAVNYQLQQILFSVFNWDSGDYEFVDRERPVFEDIMVEVSTPSLIIDGIRNITSLLVLERAIGTDDDRIVLQGPESHQLPRTNLDFSEETILAGIDGKTTIRQLRSITRLPPHEFGRALYCLLISGMVHFEGITELTDADAVPSAKEHVPLNTKPMTPGEYPKGVPVQATRLKTHNEDELRELILATEKRFRDATDEEVLNVLPDFSSDEIQKAYNSLTSIFHPPYFSFERFRDVKEPLKEIIDRMAEAYHNLMQREAAQHPLELGIPGAMESFSEEVAEVISGRLQADPIENKITPENEDTAIPGPDPFAQDLGVQNLEEEIDHDPANTVLLRALGKLLQTSGKAIDAEKHLLRALEIDPRSVETHFALADFYQTQGLKFKAFKHLNIILQLDPKNQKALDTLGMKKRKPLYEISAEDSSRSH
jgi:tetratricopeptide (TPR) repeat protein